MRLLTSKEADFLPQTINVLNRKLNYKIHLLNIYLLTNMTFLGSKVKLKDSYLLKFFFGFCKTFKKISKLLGFHLTFITADLQDIILTTPGDDIRTF